MRKNKILKLILLWALLLTTTKHVYTAEKFFLSADSIRKNEENNTIKAEGNVVITNNQYKLKANEIIYYLNEKKVFAKGNVIIFEKNTNVIYATEAELSSDLKSNFIKKSMLICRMFYLWTRYLVIVRLILHHKWIYYIFLVVKANYFLLNIQ